MTGNASRNKPIALPVTGDFAGGNDNFYGVQVPRLITLGAVIAILYLGSAILLPVAVALLLTFALSPIVSFLRRRSIPKLIAVGLTVTLAFGLIAAISFIIVSQVVTLAENIPSYQYNIIEKIRSLRDMGASGGLIERITSAVERVGAELTGAGDTPQPSVKPAPAPLPVEVVNQYGPIEMLNRLIVPLISPFATAGLVVVVVIFMLVEREALRDRFIRLVGYRDLHLTTEALQDAGVRVGRYLLMQLVVNTLYAVPIALGLWLLGVPNPLLWGVLALVLRFVPYIGPAIGMIMPMVVTFAVTPGWAPLFLTAGLFLVMELITNNVLEPWLYGSRTGLSPLAIIVSAIFWAWLWGPLGLVLSTPLTVCLVVLGRHVPQFEFLSVMFGDQPVLDPPARLYQRLLAGDPDEATDHAEEFLEEGYLVEFYDQVGIPALLLGEADRQRGVMTADRVAVFAGAVTELVAELDEFASEEEDGDNPQTNEAKPDDDKAAASGVGLAKLPDGAGHHLLCLGGRGAFDDGAAAMLAQVMRIQGAEAAVAGHMSMDQVKLRDLALDAVETVVLTYLNPASTPQARHAVRRFKRFAPRLRVGLFCPGLVIEHGDGNIAIDKTNADFLALTMVECVEKAFAASEPVKLPSKRRRAPIRRAKAA